LTEANLGDGMAHWANVAKNESAICIGTDGNARISMVEELRWLEYAQRLSGQKRCVLTDAQGGAGRYLLNAATVNGARSLAIAAGEIKAGCWADFVALDLSSPELIGWTPETLLDSIFFGAGNKAICGTCVGGRWVRGASR
jgi:formimidoylglutamate deiminase